MECTLEVLQGATWRIRDLPYNLASCYSWMSAEVCGRLEGVWEGASVPSNRNRPVTIWKDCKFKVQGDGGNCARIYGEGVSEWKDKLFRFTVEGVVDIEELRFRFVKKHLDGNYPETVYTGVIERDCIEMNGVYDKGTLGLRKKKIVEECTAERLSGVWEGEAIRASTKTSTIWKNVELKFSTVDMSIRGSGESIWKGETIPFEISGSMLDLRGNILIAKITKSHLSEKFKSKTFEFDIEVDINSYRISGSHRDGVSFTLNKLNFNSSNTVQISSLTPIDRVKSAALSKELNREIYKSLLEGIIASGTITSKQEELLARNREQYSISDSDHTQILRSLGFNHSSWAELYSQKEQPSSEKSCIICFENQINVILLPCAHLALCSSCAKNLMSCPICRESIQSTIVVYSAA
jgi:hypothetical protein